MPTVNDILNKVDEGKRASFIDAVKKMTCSCEMKTLLANYGLDLTEEESAVLMRANVMGELK